MLLVNLNNLYNNNIANVDYVGDFVNALFGKLGDVNHSVLAGGKVYACAKLSLVVLHNLGDDTLVNVADLYVTDNGFDDGTCLFDCGVVVGRYKHGTLVVDVNFNTRIFDNLIDCLSTLADYIAELVGVNGEGHDFRRPTC